MSVFKRFATERQRVAQAEFEARPEYEHARAIANILEWQGPQKHVLDRLTLEEWKALRDRLTE